jgi:predicted amidohydrolase YtcJ
MTHTYFTNGTVWTGSGTTTGALSIRDGRIEAVGAEADATAADEIIDLQGGLLLPAFGDGHCHPDLAGFEALGPRIKDCDSVEEIVEEVRRYGDAHPMRSGSLAEVTTPPWLSAACSTRGGWTRRCPAGRWPCGPGTTTRCGATPRL